MSRLPVPGGDVDAWAAILNDYLLQGHTAGGANKTPTVTALPASPVDGQEVILVDSLTAPTYQWLFRYNAGNSTAYKWEFVGGSDKVLDLGGYNVTAAAAWQISGASFAVPRSGIYDVHVVCRVTGGAGDQYAGVSLSGANPANYWGATIIAGINYASISGREVITAVAAGTIQMGHYSGTGLGSFSYRYVYIRPSRVA